MKRSNWAIFLTAIILMSSNVTSGTVFAESSPLEATSSDPLLPPFLNGELTPFRKSVLRESLDQLNQQAETLLKNKQDDQAFQVWYRELRLRKYLGVEEEIQSLARVGKIAWERNRVQDIKIITKRLEAIQRELETKKQITSERLLLFLQAYQTVHSIDDLLAINLLRLDLAQKAQNTQAEEESLEVIGKVYLAKFDYPKAAEIYESVLKKAQSASNSLKEEEYLQKLADIYDQNSQPQKAIVSKEQLLKTYTQKQEFNLLIGLTISLGRDYESLKNYQKASENYQNAFKLAWPLEYFSLADEALTALAELYSKNQQSDYALSIYRSLIEVQHSSYNYYGLMQTYNKIGDIYLNNKEYSLALNSFQEGLTIAKSLKHQVDLFENKINKVQEASNQNRS